MNIRRNRSDGVACDGSSFYIERRTRWSPADDRLRPSRATISGDDDYSELPALDWSANDFVGQNDRSTICGG